MNPVKELVRIRHGSHLYGTSTPSSDLDFKGVHVPAGETIILARKQHVIDRKVKVSTTLKNSSEDIDDQSYPLQKFIDMVSSGDTTGTEILFGAAQGAAEFMHDDWSIIWENRRLFFNKQVKGFVGYCQRQAAKYGIKGSRMAACRDIVDLLAPIATTHPQEKLGTLSSSLEDFCANHEFSAIVPIPSPNREDVLHLEVVDRKVPYTVSIKAAYDIYKKVFDNYGDRTKAALNNEGVDWKAVSHAIRVARQAIEFLDMEWITFPRPDAEQLLAIKQGKFAYKEIAPILEGLVEEVDVVAARSKLPPKSDKEAIDKLVIGFHLQQVNG